MSVHLPFLLAGVADLDLDRSLAGDLLLDLLRDLLLDLLPFFPPGDWFLFLAGDLLSLDLLLDRLRDLPPLSPLRLSGERDLERERLLDRLPDFRSLDRRRDRLPDRERRRRGERLRDLKEG